MNGWMDLNDTLEDDALGQGEGFRMGERAAFGPRIALARLANCAALF